MCSLYTHKCTHTDISTVENTEPSADSLKDCEEILTFQPGMSRTQSFEFDVNDDSKSGEDDEQYRCV